MSRCSLNRSAAGTLAALLRDAVRPNLVQTSDHTPALVHAGPFGNIAHGNCSILADFAAVRLADYVITESGFGPTAVPRSSSTSSAESVGSNPTPKFWFAPCRALKLQSGRFSVKPGKPLPAALLAEDLPALRRVRQPPGPPRHHPPVWSARRRRRQPFSH